MNLGSAMYKPLAFWNGSGANMDIAEARRARRWADGLVPKDAETRKVPQRGGDGCWRAKRPLAAASHKGL